MSIHSSLRSGGQGKKHRSVLKRYERLRILKDKNLWSEDKTVLGIAKVKQQRLKVKKEKVAKETTAGPGTPGAAPAAGEKAPASAAAAKSEKK
jgi:small basic protein (TIGR04137 family)